MSEWIKIEDGLPKTTALNLVVAERRQPFIGYLKGGHWWMPTEEGSLLCPFWNEVTHWMPLPTPPQEDEG